jgi:D-alanine-D-alanine ligase
VKNIAIVFGGKSFEHEISIVSAIAMKDVIKQNIIYIFCDQNQEFYQIPLTKIKSSLFSSGDYKKSEKLQLTQGGFVKKSMFGEKKVEFDIVLNLVHGADGEDGKLASIFEFFNIQFIGPRLEASVLSFNKHLTKYYADACDVKTIEFNYFSKNDKIEIDKFPIIIKPARLGSSIGVSIVKEQSELIYALDVAHEFDDEIIIEPFIENIKEYNLAGCKINGEYKFSIVEEPQKEQFLDFDKKYLDFNRTSKANKAHIPAHLEFALKNEFKKVYNEKFEGAIIRCDFFVVDEDVYLNEINPIPGSMANYLFDNFENILLELCDNLPKRKSISVSYEYVNKIQSAKGKA